MKTYPIKRENRKDNQDRSDYVSVGTCPFCGLQAWRHTYYLLFGTKVYMCDLCYGDVSARYWVLKDRLDINGKKDVGLMWDRARDESFRINSDTATKAHLQYQRRDAFWVSRKEE